MKIKTADAENMEGDLKITQIQRSEREKTRKSGVVAVVRGVKRKGLDEGRYQTRLGGVWVVLNIFERGYMSCGVE